MLAHVSKILVLELTIIAAREAKSRVEGELWEVTEACLLLRNCPITAANGT